MAVDSLIPRIADEVAYRENMAAIDALVQTQRYRFVVAWGKWLGFTPDTVQKQINEAVRDAAPEDVIQKIGGRWLRLADIENPQNLQRVEAIASRAPRR